MDENGVSRQKPVAVTGAGTAETGAVEGDTCNREEKIPEDAQNARPLTIGTEPANDRATDDFQVEEINGPLTFADSKRQFRSIEEVLEAS